MNQAGFIVSDNCVGCGKCIQVCPGGVLYMGRDKKPHIREFEAFGWNGWLPMEFIRRVSEKKLMRI